jgi:hypothetical protein
MTFIQSGDDGFDPMGHRIWKAITISRSNLSIVHLRAEAVVV